MDTSSAIMIQKRLQGFTLTEIMVALVISSILMAGVLTIMSSSKRTYALQSELSELQENARFIMEELARDLRMAGYGGCSGPISTNPLQGGQNDQTINDLDGNNITGFPPSDQLIIISRSDQLIPTNYTQFSQASFTDDGQFTLDTDRSLLPEDDDQIIISHCGGNENYIVNGDPFIDTNKTALVTLDSANFDDIYEPINIFKDTNTTTTYEIKWIGEDEGGFALFKCDAIDEGTPPVGNCDEHERLVEGVENMQIRYGIDTDAIPDGIPNQYSPTPAGNVESVRITLLMRTTTRRYDLEGATDKTFQLDPDITYNPQNNATLESGYRHRVFTNTIQVRN